MSEARTTGGQAWGRAALLTGQAVTRAGIVPQGVAASAAATDGRNLYKPIRVKPEETQTVQWLTPGNSIEYRIITNFDWTII